MRSFNLVFVFALIFASTAGCSFASSPNPWATDSGTAMPMDDGGQQLVADAGMTVETDSGTVDGFNWHHCDGEYYSRLQIQVNDAVANAQLGSCATGWDPVLLWIARPDGSVGNLYADGEDIDQMIPNDGSLGGEVRVGAHCAASDTWYGDWSSDRTAESYGFAVMLWNGSDPADVSADIMTMPGPDGYRLQVPIQGGGSGCQ